MSEVKSFGFFHLGNSYFYLLWLFNAVLSLFRLKPLRLKSHKHFSVFNLRPMYPQITPALHSNACTILTIIESGTQTLRRITPFRGLNP
jgi:hypothetical protein